MENDESKLPQKIMEEWCSAYNSLFLPFVSDEAQRAWWAVAVMLVAS